MTKNLNQKAFTLIELLVVIAIIGILMAISIFGLAGARESSRDARRKSDLELLRSGLELYKADCNAYPTTTVLTYPLPSSLAGNNSTTSCLSTNTYISAIPTDPVAASRNYRYATTTNGYELCAALEQGSGSVTCGGSSVCGSSTCNYKVTNP